jgi:hypothetical protein
MKQVKGPYGNINISGEPFGHANIYNNREKDFLDEIEEGIKPVVEACIKNEIDTFSSCEGHTYPDGVECFRNVDVIINSKLTDEWQKYLHKLNTQNGINLKGEVYRSLINQVFNKTYEDPVRFKILILGKKEEVEKATTILANSILNKEFPDCN